MNVMSVEICVQAVIGAYRDASKLVQRLKDKQETSEEFILPEHLTKDFEDSLKLGCVAVQTQYDHDVRRFGETYARGDAIAREQMKDILIALQQAVITHLREVYMDETSLDLHSLKETSDDSRVNATVCLGQLYQRMSTATAALKQISRPGFVESNGAKVPGCPEYSSSRSTHSSLGGRPSESQSTASDTTYNSRSAAGNDRKPSGVSMPQRRSSSNSVFSNTSEREPPARVTPGEDNVPALPFFMHIQTNRVVQTAPSDGQKRNLSPNPDASPPPPYIANLSPPVPGSEEKGQRFPPHSAFYQPPASNAHVSPLQSPGSQRRTGILGNGNERHSPPHVQTSQVHELGCGILRETDPGVLGISRKTTQDSWSQEVPLNPDYSTLEYVDEPDARSLPSASSAASQEYQRKAQQRQQAMQRAYQQQRPQDPIVRADADNTGAPTSIDPADYIVEARDPAMPSSPRPSSIHSSSSAGSRIRAFTFKRALPPGLAKVISKPAPLPLEAQPRYVRPQKPDPGDERETHIHNPPSPSIEQSKSWSNTVSLTAASTTRRLESGMRPPTSPHFRTVDSVLNLPTESSPGEFCKGAVRAQIGARKKGFSLESRRSTKKGQEFFFECTKCSFQVPAAVSTALPSGGRGAVKREKMFDPQIWVSPGGIKYRWVFLAKSHVPSKLAATKGTTTGRSSAHKNSNAAAEDVFGCYICHSEGAARGWLDDNCQTTQRAESRPVMGLGSLEEGNTATGGKGGDNEDDKTSKTTPTFTGVRAFLAHLETHRTASRTPGFIVATEMNCIVGRVADDSEDFDLNLPPLLPCP
ncbi:hypothetical protein ABEF93_005505 [Exophiala dermatitidis]